jgi:hypothetical protein
LYSVFICSTLYFSLLDATLKFEVELLSIGVKPRSQNPYFFSSENVFAEIDKDEDGIIHFTEFIEYFAKMRLTGRAKEVYESEDTDRDGIISWEEFTGPKGSVNPTLEAKKTNTKLSASGNRKTTTGTSSVESVPLVDKKKLESIKVDNWLDIEHTTLHHIIATIT